jgi:proprotein convertase subtilisin/kexin type 5
MEVRKNSKMALLWAILGVAWLGPVAGQMVRDGTSGKSSRATIQNQIGPSSPWQPIRVLFDFSNINVAPQVMVYLKSTVFGSVQKKLQSVMMIRDSNNVGPFSNTNCVNMTIPSSYRQSSTLADVVIFVILYSAADSTIANSAPCLLSETTRRPTVGQININLNYLRWGADQLDSTISTMLHETLHVIVLSPVLYTNYLTANRNTIVQATRLSATNTTQTLNAIASSGLLGFAQQYFNCPSMTGVFLENQGSTISTNSHWNKLLLGNEVMTSQRTGYPSFSLFSFYLMSDSGWYQMDFSQADVITWGKYAGCDFVNQACNTRFKEFCTEPGELSCSVDYRAKTVCTQSLFTPSCYYNEYFQVNLCSNTVNFNFTSTFEEPGVNSRCFNVQINGRNTANCYRFQIAPQGITVTVQGQTYTCTSSGQVISISQQLNIVCPDINDFANRYSEKTCENDCNGQGTCTVSGQCRCNYFYTGSACQTKVSCQPEDQSICSILEKTNLPLIANSINWGGLVGAGVTVVIAVLGGLLG